MSPEDIARRLELFKKEWLDLNPMTRYSIIFAFILILLIGLDKQFNFGFFSSISKSSLRLSVENLYFVLANTIIFVIFISLVIDRLWVNLKILWYKFRYPLRKLNKNFYIISFQGRVCLLDNKKKELRWIKSFKTAVDLDFVGEWTNVDVDITQSLMLINTNFVTKDGKNIKLSDFRYADGIHTQSEPGT